jgi:phage baseplate assembly protein W
MAYVVETQPVIPVDQQSIGLGVRFTNLDSIFQTIYTTNEQVKENLKTLLLTRIGERYMQPSFGTNLLNIVFEPNTEQIKEVISDILIDPINTWLPYIVIENLNVTTAEDDPTLPYHVSISLTYTINDFSTDTITFNVNNDNTITVV